MFRTRRLTFATAALGITALALTGCGGGGAAAGTAATLDPDEEITLDFAFWGNDVRAELYDEAIALFNEEYPNITVRTSFLAWTEFWEKRQTEAAGGGLPDVMQMDLNYLRQYSQNNLLLDLEPYLGDVIDTDTISDAVLANGVLDGKTIGIPISTNALGMYVNPTLAEQVGVEPFTTGTWEDYEQWLSEVRKAAKDKGMDVWGGANFAASLQNFEIRQRAAGEDLFTEDGEINFTREDLADYWSIGIPYIEDDVVTSQQRQEELLPLTGFDAAQEVSVITWDTMGAGFLANLGAEYQNLQITAPPVTVEGAKDLYQKAGMLMSASAKSDHPEAAATFIDFMTNDPEASAVMGMNRGIPASQSALDGTDISGINAQVLEYEESIADRLGDAPPVPVIGYGQIEQLFRTLSQELGFGTLTVDEAVDQLFNEMELTIEG
jgi:multiple sugar transport system substrate-binding protein